MKISYDPGFIAIEVAMATLWRHYVFYIPLVSLKVNDSYLNDDLSIANCMNSYFSSVFTVEDHENFPVSRQEIL